MDFRTIRVTELADKVRRKELSAREVTQQALDAIATTDPDIGAFVTVDAEGALAAATELDERIARTGADDLPLAGVPLGVKDLEDARGLRTTHGSALFADAPPAATDSPLVAALRAAGCIVVGKTNTPEDGHTADTVNAVAGRTANPVNPERSPGGSSGGSAAALAAGMVPLATGSDGGGSIRIPAALCGFSGFKPTNGMVPTGPEPPGSNLLGVRGPMALRTADIAASLAVAVGADTSVDPFGCLTAASGPLARPDAAAEAGGAIPGVGNRPLRIVWVTGTDERVDREIAAVLAAAMSTLSDAGMEITTRAELFDPDPLGDWWTLWTASMAVRHGHRRGTPEWDLLWPEVRSLTEWGCDRVTAADVTRALDGAWRVNNDVHAALGDADVLMMPTVAGQTPVAGELGTVNGETTPMWVNYTYPFNLGRHPAGSVRAGYTSDGMPVGLQIVGRHHHDAMVLGVMAACEALLVTPAGGGAH